VESRPSPVSEAELEALKVLWDLGPSTVRAVQAELRRRGRPWAYTTVLTLLQRLEAKGCTRSDRAAAANVYTATASRSQLLGRQLRDLVDKFCDGASSPIVAALAEAGRLTPKDVEELRRLLDRIKPPPDG
jgi:BlaI family transcriptional regulator, penicillinase repressor